MSNATFPCCYSLNNFQLCTNCYFYTNAKTSTNIKDSLWLNVFFSAFTLPFLLVSCAKLLPNLHKSFSLHNYLRFLLLIVIFLPNRAIKLDGRTFPPLAGKRCSSYGYHESKVSRFLCDFDNSLSKSGASQLMKQIDSKMWSSCRDDNSDEWSLAIIITESLKTGKTLHCISERLMAANHSIWKKIRKGISRLRKFWRDRTACPIDLLLVLSSKFEFCNEITRRGVEIHNLTLIVDMSEEFRNKVGIGMDWMWMKPRLVSKMESAKISLLNDAIKLFTMLAGAVTENSNLDKNMPDEFVRLQALLPKKTEKMDVNGIPTWAWICFSSAISLSLISTYIGMYIGSTGRFAHKDKKGKLSTMRLRKRSTWAAGFGGGVMQFNPNQGSRNRAGSQMLGSKFRSIRHET